MPASQGQLARRAGLAEALWPIKVSLQSSAEELYIVLGHVVRTTKLVARVAEQSSLPSSPS